MPASRASVRVLTIFGIVIIGLLVVLLISNSSKAQSQQITHPIYEYKVLTYEESEFFRSRRGNYDPVFPLDTTFTRRFNTLGSDGWRLVNITYEVDSDFYIK